MGPAHLMDLRARWDSGFEPSPVGDTFFTPIIQGVYIKFAPPDR